MSDTACSLADTLLDECAVICNVVKKTTKLVGRAASDDTIACQHGCDKCPSGPQTFDAGTAPQAAGHLTTSAQLQTPLLSPHKAHDVINGPCSAAASPDKAAISSSAISSRSSRCCASPAVERLLLGISTVGLQDPGAHPCAVPCPGAPHTTPTSPARHALDICSTASEITSAQILSAQQAAQAGAPTAGDATQDWPCDEADPSDNPIVLGTSLFFARVPPTVSYESIMELFTQFGTVLTLNLFRPWATAKTSKGCGIIVYEHITAAIAAMEALHNKYHWTGGETTMVVEWADPSRHRRENPNTKGVFEAKHKTMAMGAGQKGHFRYRAQMRRAVALSLQQAANAVGSTQFLAHSLPGMMPFATNSTRAGPMVNRGVNAMLPQLAGTGMAGASTGAWGLQNAQAAQQAAYMNALAAATAAPLGSTMASNVVLNNTICSGSVASVLPRAQSFGAASMLSGVTPLGARTSFSEGSWGADTPTLASLAAGSACSMEPGSPAFAASPAGSIPVLQQADFRSVLNPAVLQQARGPSRLAGVTPGVLDHGHSGSPTCMQVQINPNPFMHQESVSYLGAMAGLAADANTLAAAAAAIAHNSAAGLPDCHTPLAANQPLTFVADSCSSIHMGAAAAAKGAPMLPQQQHWLNLHKQHYAGSSGSLPGLAVGCNPYSGSAGMCGSAGNLAGLAADTTPCGTPTYLQQGMANTDPGLNAAAWCGNIVGGRSAGWW